MARQPLRTKLQLALLKREYQSPAPFEQREPKLPLGVFSSKKAGLVKSSSLPDLANEKPRKGNSEALTKALQIMNYVNSKRPRSWTRLRIYAPAIGSADVVPVSKHSRKSSCVDFSSVLASTLSTTKLPLGSAHLRAPMSSKNPLMKASKPNPIVKPTKPLRVSVPQTKQVTNRIKPKKIASTASQTQSPSPKKRTIFSRQIEGRKAFPDASGGFSYELHRYNLRCMSANSASLTERSESLINSQALTPWDYTSRSIFTRVRALQIGHSSFEAKSEVQHCSQQMCPHLETRGCMNFS